MALLAPTMVAKASVAKEGQAAYIWEGGELATLLGRIQILPLGTVTTEDGASDARTGECCFFFQKLSFFHEN